MQISNVKKFDTKHYFFLMMMIKPMKMKLKKTWKTKVLLSP